MNHFFQISHLSDRKSIAYLQFVLATIGLVWVDLSSSEPISPPHPPKWTSTLGSQVKSDLTFSWRSATDWQPFVLQLLLISAFCCTFASCDYAWKSIQRRKKETCGSRNLHYSSMSLAPLNPPHYCLLLLSLCLYVHACVCARVCVWSGSTLSGTETHSAAIQQLFSPLCLT